jgi:hypothetical protein
MEKLESLLLFHSSPALCATQFYIGVKGWVGAYNITAIAIAPYKVYSYTAKKCTHCFWPWFGTRYKS